MNDDNRNQPISLTSTPEEPTPISLDPIQEQTGSSPAVVESRSKKIAFATKSTTSVTADNARQILASGQENSLRQETAADADMRRSIQERQLITEMAKQAPGGFATEDQVSFAKAQSSLARFMGQREPTNPNTVLEKYYSGEYLKPMYNISDQFNKGSFMPDAMQQIPEHVKALQQVGETIGARREVAQKLYQDVKDTYDQQSLGGWAWDQAKSFIPGEYELALRSNIGKLYSGVALRGTALKEALANLEGSRSTEEYHDRLKALLDGISSPQMKVDVANAALGSTTSKETLDNVFTGVDIASLPLGGAATLARKGAVGVAQTIAVRQALKQTELKAVTTEATKDAVKSMEGTGPTLRELVNQHFGEQSATIQYKMDQASKEYSAASREPLKPSGPRTGTWDGQDVEISKAFGGKLKVSYVDPENPQNMTSSIVSASEVTETGKPGRFANEGNRAQYLTKLANQIKDLDAQMKDLKNWHGEYLGAKGKGPLGEEAPDVLTYQQANKLSPDELQRTLEQRDWTDIHMNQDYSVSPEVKAPIGRGDLGAAATNRVTDNIIDDLSHKADPEKVTVESLPSFLQSDDDAFGANPGHGGSEIVNRVLEQGRNFRTNILNAAQNIMRVQRLPAALQTPEKWNEALRKAVDAVKEYTKESYPGLQNSILNIANPRYQPLTNTYHMDMIIGQDTGEYFTSKEMAEAYNRQYGLLNTSIERSGLGWYIKATKPLNETSSVVRDMLLTTADNLPRDSWANAFLGWARTPEETLSFEHNFQRKLATYNASSFIEFAKETAQDIGKGGLKNLKNWKEWERGVDALRHMPDLDNPSLIGRTLKDGGEMDDFWQSQFNRLPTDTEKSAYFAFKRVNEYDRVLRSMASYRNKSRVGAESHSLWVTAADGTKKSSDFFDGVTHKGLPSDEDTLVIVGGKEGGIVYQGSASRMPPKLREKYASMVERGEQKVIQLYDPEKRPLQSFLDSDSRIRYVVSENTESRPISLEDQVPRRGGGHFDYDYDNYLKQANVRFDEKTGLHWYEGDRTVMPMNVRGLGKDVAVRLNAVRELIAAGKEDEAKALAQSERGIPQIPWEEHRGWYESSKGAKGELLPARLSKTEPFRIVDRNAMISDMDNELKMRYGPGFRDGTRQGSLARQAQIQYTGERDNYDIKTLNDIGTRGNPLYSYEPAKLVDPITTMNRALSKIVSSTFMDDYKIYSVERWVRQARPWLNVKQMSEIDKSPFHFFNQADENWVKNMPAETYRQLMDSRMKIMQLVGTPSKIDNFLHSAQQALADSIYGKLGPKAIDLTPSWLLPSLKDPFKFIRSIVFNAKMGLFSVPQLFVHAMTTVNAIGIAGPKVGFQGLLGALFHGWAHINPDMIEHMDGLAVKMGIGWRPGEFKESMGLVYGPTKRTGFMDVNESNAYLDSPLASKVVGTGFSKFLDAGQMFFRGGVTTTRAASWHMAFKEFREVHPTGRLTDDDLQHIINRADDLSHNMTRASTSMVTKGPMSIPAQFYTYQLRLAELMTGSRLTGVEKARLLATNAAFFGIPAAAGLYGYPFGDNIRRYADQHGYVMGDNFIADGMMNGIPAMMGQLATGTTYNVGGRYGAQGIGTLGDITDGDKTMWDILGGASYSSLKSVWQSGNGFRTSIIQAWRGEGDFQLTSDDALGPLKIISSVNGIYKTLAGINYHTWNTQNGAPLYPVTAAQAIFQGVSGLTDQRATDVWQKSITLKEHKAYDNYLYGQFQKEFTLGTQAMHNKDPEGYKVHIKNAFAYLKQFGYPPEKIPEAVASAVKNNQPIINRVDYDMFVKDPRTRDMDTYKKIQANKPNKELQ